MTLSIPTFLKERTRNKLGQNIFFQDRFKILKRPLCKFHYKKFLFKAQESYNHCLLANDKVTEPSIKSLRGEGFIFKPCQDILKSKKKASCRYIWA